MSPETNPPNSPEPYSIAADLLSKFHTSPDWIQALWLIAVPALIFGLAYLVKEIVVALARRWTEPRGALLYNVYRDEDDVLVVQPVRTATPEHDTLTLPSPRRAPPSL
jgi:hypothetical protein